MDTIFEAQAKLGETIEKIYADIKKEGKRLNNLQRIEHWKSKLATPLATPWAK